MGNFFRTTNSIRCFMTVSSSLPGLDPLENQIVLVPESSLHAGAGGGQIRSSKSREHAAGRGGPN
jgi:hypothetical protein